MSCTPLATTPYETDTFSNWLFREHVSGLAGSQPIERLSLPLRPPVACVGPVPQRRVTTRRINVRYHDVILLSIKMIHRRLKVARLPGVENVWSRASVATRYQVVEKKYVTRCL